MLVVRHECNVEKVQQGNAAKEPIVEVPVRAYNATNLRMAYRVGATWPLRMMLSGVKGDTRIMINVRYIHFTSTRAGCWQGCSRIKHSYNRR